MNLNEDYIGGDAKSNSTAQVADSSPEKQKKLNKFE